jgi:hypothetical protein
METVFQSWQEIPFSENHIKQLHRDLLRYSEKDDRHRGEYKKLSNSVAAFDDSGKQVGIVFETASPFDTPRLMAELVAWLAEAHELQRLHPLLMIGIFTEVFLEIHPFQDGNGRLSRILTTLLLLKAGYAYVSYSSLESMIENSKEGYYLALCQTQGTIRSEAPNWQPWLTFFLRLAAAEAPLGRQGGAGKTGDRRVARVGRSDSRSCAPTWPRHHRGYDSHHRCQPQHFERPFSPSRGRAAPCPSWRRKGFLVCPAMIALI